MTQFEELLRTLSAKGVEYILVGGVAATAHGAARLTQDLDLVYRRTPANIARLATAVAPLHPYPRGAPPGLPFLWDAATIERGLNFTLSTDLGALDLLGEVTGGGGYDDLLPQTVELHISSVKCRCLSLDTLIRVKRAAGRPKDFEAIAELEALADERAQHDRESDTGSQ